MSDSSVCKEAQQELLFSKIAQDLRSDGFSINPNALPEELGQSLYAQVKQLKSDQFIRAGVGRNTQQLTSDDIRRDQIRWIDGNTKAGKDWLDWSEQLQKYLNRRLFLGLFSFESHFAHYRSGDFYQRHLDAFKGQSNRVLSMVVYLNPHWREEDGGELMLYRDEADLVGIKVVPQFANIVIFLSEEFPHEVLPSECDRYSIAGWFRINTSQTSRVDPAS